MARRYLDQRLKLQMLRVVATIETSGSILKAAAALGVSQPALTKTLQELEDIVQLRLFDRHSRGVRVTDAGRQLVRTARTILAEIARLDEHWICSRRREAGPWRSARCRWPPRACSLASSLA